MTRTRSSSRNLFISALLVLVLTNLAVLAGVRTNRSGPPDFQGILTERELPLPWFNRAENSGLALRLSWRNLAQDSSDSWERSSPKWFNSQKMQELGFKIETAEKTDRASYQRQLPKEVYIVLEFDGELYREALQRAKNEVIEKEKLVKEDSDDKNKADQLFQSQKRLKAEQLTQSRLFAMDAGLDQAKLRAKYQDQTKFIITRGLVRPRYYYNQKTEKTSGYITRLSVKHIHVALPFRQQFEAIMAQQKKSRSSEPRSPRYTIELAYGKRLEPYIVAVKQIATSTQESP